MTSPSKVAEAIAQYPRDSQLWIDGISFQHWKLIFQLGFRDCDCKYCIRGLEIWNEAHAERKTRKPRLIGWLGG
jgi:hypothetical protein